MTLSHEKGTIKSILEISNDVISSQVSKQLIQIITIYQKGNKFDRVKVNNLKVGELNSIFEELNASDYCYGALFCSE